MACARIVCPKRRERVAFSPVSCFLAPHQRQCVKIGLLYLHFKVGKKTPALFNSLSPFFVYQTPQDVSNGRELVLKRASLQSTEGRAVYEKEASIMRSLAHPNIVQVSLVSVYVIVHCYHIATRVIIHGSRVLKPPQPGQPDSQWLQ